MGAMLAVKKRKYGDIEMVEEFASFEAIERQNDGCVMQRKSGDVDMVGQIGKTATRVSHSVGYVDRDRMEVLEMYSVAMCADLRAAWQCCALQA